MVASDAATDSTHSNYILFPEPGLTESTTGDLTPREADLVRGLLARETRSIARVLSLVEDETESGRRILDRLYGETGDAYRIGVTGPPGSGKSTLTDLFTRLLRKRGDRVGVIAVDPSSPFSGGAILGDRIRMQSALDEGVFIRSMASRGSLGGLAATTERACETLDAAGFDWAIIETVGVGQSEMEVVSVADTTVVVLVPESGDAVQTMKAGLMEAGDIFVVNKYDREGGGHLEKELNVLLSVQHDRAETGTWKPPVLTSVATRGEGASEILDAVAAHRDHFRGDAALSREVHEQKLRHRIRTLVRARLLDEAWTRLEVEAQIEDAIGDVLAKKVSPYALVDQLVRQIWDERSVREGRRDG